MKVCVNDKVVGPSPGDGATLEALLDSLRTRGEIGSDEVVVGLQVDQCSWAPADMDRLQQTQLGGVGEVLIATEDLRGYARRILTDAGSMLAVLEEATGRVADELRSGPLDKANMDLFNLLHALQRFLACLYHVTNTCGLAQGSPDPQRQLMAQVAGTLDLIQSSQERQDWASLAAQLEMDLLPALKGFEGVLHNMTAEV